MSTKSPVSSQRNTQEYDPKPNPYSDAYPPSPALEEAGVPPTTPDSAKISHVRSYPTQPKFGRFGALGSAYRSTSWILGFKEPLSLILFIIFGGALVGFCLARSFMMRPSNLRTKTIAGEWYWYKRPLYKPSIFLHIYLTILGGILAIFQFLPAIRRRAVVVHRLNGYLVLILLIGGNTSGAIVGRAAFGGELNSQSAYYTLGALIVGCAILGYLNVNHTRKHRKWMLRTVAITASPITARLIALCAKRIVTRIGTYYAVWRCDEIFATLATTEFPPGAISQYPYSLCNETGIDPFKTHIAVRASIDGDALNYASAARAVFGMALWFGILIHVIGVEFYIRKTDEANQHRRGFVLERLDDDEDGVGKRTPDDR